MKSLHIIDFFLHNQATVVSSDSFHFLKFAPIDELISNFNDESFRCSLGPLGMMIINSICKSKNDSIFQFNNQDNRIFQFIASRIAIIIYLCLKYSHLLPPYVHGPYLCDFFIIKQIFDGTCIHSELLEHYLKQIAVNYINNIKDSISISKFNFVDHKNRYATIVYHKIYELVPWYSQAIDYHNLLYDFLYWRIPVKIGIGILKKINVKVLYHCDLEGFIKQGIE